MILLHFHVLFQSSTCDIQAYVHHVLRSVNWLQFTIIILIP